jgi:hypothetical protein
MSIKKNVFSSKPALTAFDLRPYGTASLPWLELFGVDAHFLGDYRAELGPHMESKKCVTLPCDALAR